ncbi:MATE family efflux transporter [Cardinium endosymbiont of Nabis limbatus]|uniref:MATE family efflux transporter n=1 Tax=Cardinium endosymbiont of Nabis limbatus TaxID=3066217 RepID=UPI003AF4088C
MALLVARADRKQNHQKVKQILKHGLLLNVFFALVFIMVLGILSFYLSYAKQSQEIVALGRPYLLIISIALIPSAINNMIKRYLEGMSYGKTALRLSFFTLTTNALFNVLLIYGQCGFPMLGLNRAASAIVLSETLTAIAGACYVFYISPQNQPIMSFNFGQISWRYFRKIVWISWPVGIQFGLEGAYLLFIATIVGWISIEAQAAHAILFNICQLITIFAIGLGLSGSILVTQQHHPQSGCLVRKVAFMVCSMIGMVSILVGIMLFTISPYIISFYKPVDTVRTLVSLLMIHVSLFQLFYSLCYWGSSILRGLNDNAFLLLCSIITQLIGAAICYILVVQYKWSISGVWIALILERILLSLFLLIRFDYKTRIAG